MDVPIEKVLAHLGALYLEREALREALANELAKQQKQPDQAPAHQDQPQD